MNKNSLKPYNYANIARQGRRRATEKQKVGWFSPDPLDTAEPLAAGFGPVPDLNLVLGPVPFHGLVLVLGALARALVLVILFSLHRCISFPFVIIV